MDKKAFEMPTKFWALEEAVWTDDLLHIVRFLNGELTDGREDQGEFASCPRIDAKTLIDHQVWWQATCFDDEEAVRHKSYIFIWPTHMRIFVESGCWDEGVHEDASDTLDMVRRLTSTNPHQEALDELKKLDTTKFIYDDFEKLKAMGWEPLAG